MLAVKSFFVFVLHYLVILSSRPGSVHAFTLICLENGLFTVRFLTDRWQYNTTFHQFADITPGTRGQQQLLNICSHQVQKEVAYIKLKNSHLFK